jgi:hypothetical protein
MLEDGTLRTRKVGFGGMKDRIVNGHQFGKVQRRKSWPIQKVKEDILALDVYWYVTYNDTIKHIPRDIEKSLLKKYFKIFGQLPRWNKTY